MALVDNTFYVANTDALVAIDYEQGATSISSEGRHLADFKPDGHWTRSLIVNE